MNKPIKNEEIKEIELNGLCTFRNKCNELGVKYYLAFGTLLGAARHQGFIPWDDDIDVLVPRCDYDYMLKNFKAFETDDWEIVSNEINHDYCLLWSKYSNKRTTLLPTRFNTGYTYGLSIDLFPLDYLEATTIDDASLFIEQTREYYNSRMRKIQARAVTKRGLSNDVRRLARKTYFKTIGRIFGNATEIIEDTNLYIHNRCQGGPYAIYAYDKYCRAWGKKDFENDKFVEKQLIFEKELFRVPINYDNVLMRSYGDYMKLPPKEKQISLHNFDAFYKTVM